MATSQGDEVKGGGREDLRRSRYSGFTADMAASTIHGMRHITNNDLSRCTRCFWAVILLTSTVIASWSLQTFLATWLNPTYFNQILIENERQATFPTLTFCSKSLLSGEYMDSHLEARRMLELWFPQIGPYLYDTGEMEEAHQLNMSEYNATQAIIEGSPWNGSDIIRSISFLQDNLSGNIMRDVSRDVTAVIRRSGLCQEIDLQLTINNTGVENGVFIGLEFPNVQPSITEYGTLADKGGTLLVHMKEVSPTPSDSAVSIKPGIGTIIRLSKSKTVALEARGGCVYVKQDPLEFYPSYTALGCELECERKHLLKQCGCKELQHPGTDRVCVTEEEMICQHKIHHRDGCKERCKDQCELTVYNLNVDHFEFTSSPYLKRQAATYNSTDQLASLLIYVETFSVMVQKQTLAFTFSDLWGKVGGILGLLLGASLMSMMEVLQAILQAIHHSVSSWWVRSAACSGGRCKN